MVHYKLAWLFLLLIITFMKKWPYYPAAKFWSFLSHTVSAKSLPDTIISAQMGPCQISECGHQQIRNHTVNNQSIKSIFVWWEACQNAGQQLYEVQQNKLNITIKTTKYSGLIWVYTQHVYNKITVTCPTNKLWRCTTTTLLVLEQWEDDALNWQKPQYLQYKKWNDRQKTN